MLTRGEGVQNIRKLCGSHINIAPKFLRNLLLARGQPLPVLADLLVELSHLLRFKLVFVLDYPLHSLLRRGEGLRKPLWVAIQLNFENISYKWENSFKKTQVKKIQVTQILPQKDL